MVHYFLPFLLIFTLLLVVVKSFLVTYARKDVCLKKIEDGIRSAKTTFIYFTIALVLILLRPPFDKLLAI